MSQYSAVHEKLNRLRGRPETHACAHCGKPATDWAYDHENPDPDAKVFEKQGNVYSLKPEYYMPLCRSCHVHFDKGDHCNSGHEYTPENTYLYRGHRYCKTCRSAARQRYRERVPVGHPEWRPGAAAEKKAPAKSA